MPRHTISPPFRHHGNSAAPEALPANRSQQPNPGSGFPLAKPQVGPHASRDREKPHPQGDMPFRRHTEYQTLNEDQRAAISDLRETNRTLGRRVLEPERRSRESEHPATVYLPGDNLRTGCIIIDPHLRIGAFNPDCARLFRLLSEDVGQPVERLTHTIWNRNELMGDILAVFQRGLPITREIRRGRTSWLVAHLAPACDRRGRVEALVVYFNDISPFKREQERNRLLAQLFQQSNEAQLITDADGRIMGSNDSFSLLTGYTGEEIVGRTTRRLLAGQKSKELFATLSESLRIGNHWQGELHIRSKDGTILSIWTTATPLRDEQRKTINYTATLLDVTARAEREQDNEYRANHDALTGLLNRFSLMQRLSQSLEQARSDEHHFAVLFIDLDRFKEVNDSLGHYMGDLLLVEVAARLVAAVRASDIVARLGGDEFVVAMPHIRSAIDPAYLADKIRRVLSQPFLLDGHELLTTPSIGISVFPDDGGNVAELLKNADRAMYHAKSQGRNNYQFFMQEMHTIARERLLLEHDLRLAVERNEFILHFQPQVDLASGLVIGVKAMLRWRHPLRGIITPDRFISTADASGLILRIDHLSLEMACRQLAAWTAEKVPRVTMAVKLSTRQFRQKTLAENVAHIISVTGIDPRLLDLEITESAAMDNPDETIRQLERLSRLGLKLSIDNFGAGYSSLSYVRRFPVNRLIIDRSFVQGIQSNAGDAAIVAATISLGHSIGTQVGAKGIETEAQLTLLAAQRCDVGQGYLFSRPLAADGTVEFIRRHAGRPVVDLSGTPPGIVAAPFLAEATPAMFSSGE